MDRFQQPTIEEDRRATKVEMMAHEHEARLSRLRLHKIQFKGELRELLKRYIYELNGEGVVLNTEDTEALITELTVALDDPYLEVITQLEKQFEDAVSDL